MRWLESLRSECTMAHGCHCTPVFFMYKTYDVFNCSGVQGFVVRDFNVKPFFQRTHHFHVRHRVKGPKETQVLRKIIGIYKPRQVCGKLRFWLVLALSVDRSRSTSLFLLLASSIGPGLIKKRPRPFITCVNRPSVKIGISVSYQSMK